MNADKPEVTFEEVENIFKKFPSVLKNIKLFWKDHELLSLYIEKLMKDTRNDVRSGFPLEATEMLVLLYNQRIKLFTKPQSLMKVKTFYDHYD